MIIENEYLKVMQVFRIMDKREQTEKFFLLSSLTRDKVLKEKIVRYATLSKHIPNETSLKLLKNKEHSQMLIETLAAKRDLINYVEQIINGKKEYWQIVAEQHGWTPPKKNVQ